MPRPFHRRSLYLAVCFLAAPAVLTAQGAKPLEIGATAPDFSMNGATRYGVLAKPSISPTSRGRPWSWRSSTRPEPAAEPSK